jgi:orotidine-5'-phosphate decarboxylase
MNAMINEDIKPTIVKPNIAFYAQYGFAGLKALKKIIKEYKQNNFLIILDAKRGDIGKTSLAYAREVFDFWKADAITISPYMGSDSVTPFIEYYKKEKGIYILAKTSNPGADDLQNLKIEEKPLYMKTAENIIKWHKPGVGAVVGATYPKELEELSSLFVNSNKNVPILIPGIGSQGGSAKEVIEIFKRTNNNSLIHRISSSSGIIYAYKNEVTDDYAGAAVKAVRKLKDEIGL